LRACDLELVDRLLLERLLLDFFAAPLERLLLAFFAVPLDRLLLVFLALPLDRLLLEPPPERLLLELLLLDRLLRPLELFFFSSLRASSSDFTSSLSRISPRQPSISSSSSLVNVMR